MTLLKASLAMAAALACLSAAATPIVSQSTGLTNPTTTIDFTEVPLANGTVMNNQYAGLGVSLSGFYYNGCTGCVDPSPNGQKPDITSFFNDTNVFSTALSMDFDSTLEAVAFSWASNFGTFTFAAFLGNTLVEQFSVDISTRSVNGSSGWGYYGFSGIAFDRINITASQSLLIDGLQLRQAAQGVPEPATGLLAGLALAGLAFTRRRD